jgi:hypothetical protein
MSEEMGDGTFEPLEPESSTPDADNAGTPVTDSAGTSETDGTGAPGLEEVRNDLLAAIEELGLGSRETEDDGSPAAGCYLAIVPVDRHGQSGVVVGWIWRDSAVPGEPVPSAEIESVDILNEALGPLLLALGFPIEPYAVDGRWIVTGSRMTNASSETVGSPGALMD